MPLLQSDGHKCSKYKSTVAEKIEARSNRSDSKWWSDVTCNGAGLICLCWGLVGLDRAAMAFYFFFLGGGGVVAQPIASTCDVCQRS